MKRTDYATLLNTVELKELRPISSAQVVALRTWSAPWP